MFNAPEPPDTLVSRQIECISCKEVFTIAEDDAIRKRLRTEHWRLPPDHYPDTRLRYQSDRTRRSVTPEARSNPALNPDQFLNFQPERRDYVNCPRCGADNRNWLHLASSSRSGSGSVFSSQLISITIAFLVMVAILAIAIARFDLGEPRRSLALIVSIFLAGLLPLLLILPQWKRGREHRYLRKAATSRPIFDISPPTRTGLILFIIFVFLVPFILFIVIPWTFDRGITLLAPEREPTLVQRLDQISSKLPAAIDDTQETEREPARNAITSLETLVNERRFTCETTQIEAMIGRLQLVRTSSGTTERREMLIAESLADLQALRDGSRSACRDELVRNAIASLLLLQAFDEELCARQKRVALCSAAPRSRDCWKGMATVATPLPPECNTVLIAGLIDELKGLGGLPGPPEGDPLDRAAIVLGDVRQLTQGSVDGATVQRIENDVSTLETFIEPEEQGWFTAGRAFLRNWIWFVGLVSLTSILISLDAIDRYDRRVDRHLPRPIFYSVANMTRVVIWEAKRSLEIDGDMSHVRWTKAERNGDGGIILHGLHYDVFEPGQNVDPLFQKVRAQHYRIKADPWGRIQSADIRNVRVPRPPQDPGPSIGTEFFQHVPVPPQRERVPVS